MKKDFIQIILILTVTQSPEFVGTALVRGGSQLAPDPAIPAPAAATPPLLKHRNSIMQIFTY